MRTVLFNVQIPDASWSPYNAWTSFQSSPQLQHTGNFSLYQVAIWPEVNRVTLYNIPNDFNNFYGHNPALPDTGLADFIAYRESFAVASFPMEGDSHTDEQSHSLRTAFEAIFDLIAVLDPADTYGMSFQGHGSAYTTLFENRINLEDSRAIFEHFREAVGKNIDFLDFSSNCDVGSFAFLDRFGDLVDYLIASDHPVGGYLSGDNPNALASVFAQPRQNYAHIWGEAETIEEGLRATLDRHQQTWDLVGAADLVGTDQHAAIYDTSAFAAFARALAETIAENSTDLTGWGATGATWEDLFIRLPAADAQQMREMFAAVFIESIGTYAMTGGTPTDGLSTAHDSVTAPRQASTLGTRSGGADADVMTGAHERDVLMGLGGDDVLDGQGGDDALFGYRGQDELDGGAGVDRLFGGDGDDAMSGGAGADHLSGGTGADTASYAASSGGVTVDLGSGAGLGGDAAGDTLISVENVVGSDHADILTGDGAANLLAGGSGADYLVGGAGADRFVWEAAVDSPTSGGGFDAVGDFETGVDLLDFGFDQERVFITRAGTSSFVYFGQAGGVFGGIVQVVGLVQGSDVFSEGAGVFLYGDGSSEDLRGGAGADVIVGFDGADVIRGGAGSDALYGGAGGDSFIVSAVTDSDFTGYDAIGDFASGSDTVDLSALVAAGQTNIALARFGGSTFVYFGQGGAATFSGVVLAAGVVQGSDLVLGSDLGLVFYGSGDDEELRGGAGNDTVLAGDGADTIIGGDGADSLFGGAGADLFRYSAAGHSTSTAWDTIQDFQVGADRIDLRGVASEVALSTFGGNTFVYFVPNGSGGYDGLIIANGVTLTQDDVLVTGEGAPDLGGKGEALVLPPLDDGLDPLVLPVGLEAKNGSDETPIVCRPGDTGAPAVFADFEPLELGLSDFMGRDPHRLMQTRDFDWVM